MAGRIRLGTQAWTFEAWSGPFYPDGTRPADYLTTYARAFETVEIDSTFYAVPAATTVASWRSRVPDNFCFAPKLPQEITHERRLRDARPILEEFVDRMRGLGPALGPMLIQMPPDFGPSELPAVTEFLPLLPDDLAFAIEFRHRGWMHEGMLALLARYRIAAVLSDGRWIPRKQMLDLAAHPTAPFVYIRWIGPDRSLVDFSRVQVDRTRDMESWSRAMTDLSSRGIDVYGYMSNQFAGHAPASVRELQRLVGQAPVPPERMGEQMSLF